MIRAAFLAVLALGGLIAFGAFFLARGSSDEVAEIPAPTSLTPEPLTPATPEVDKLYFLRGIDFEQGDITLMLYNAADQTVIVRDQSALLAAKDSAYVNTSTSVGEAAGSFALMLFGAPPEETFANIYRDDQLIASVSCTNTACGSFSDNPDVHYAGLLEHAVPYTPIRDEFDNYDTYLAAIEAVETDPGFLMLDSRPREGFPSDRRGTHVILTLPSVITPDDEPLDPAAHEAVIRAAVTPHLSDTMSIDWVRIDEQGTAALADIDNNQLVLVDGQQVPFLDATFYFVRVKIDGTLSLPSDAYDAITQATLSQYDVDAAFASFVTGTLPTTCVDCYFLKVDGEFSNDTRVYDWRSEFYLFDYYDLRDAP